MRPSCQAVRGAFLAWFDEEVGPDARGALDLHIEQCPDCATAWEEYRATVALLRSLEPLEVPDRVLQGIRGRLQKPSVVERILLWIVPLPRRLPASVVAVAATVLILVGVWQWRPWVTQEPSMPSTTVALQSMTASSAGVFPASSWNPYSRRMLAGGEDFLSPVRALEGEMERPPTSRATLVDDMVLDLTGSEEIFNRIQEILREFHGKMFLMGIRHRGSGDVIRSRVLIQVPMEKYDQVVQQIESLGPVHRLFVERDALPFPPDRLRIRIMAGDSSIGFPSPFLQEVAWE